jgi:NAD(P)-dependent dehydrogenase (short-subunit alcohol dehydrogenase family)
LHTLTFLPLDLSNLPTVTTFADQALSALASTNLDYLFLNAAISEPSGPPGTTGPNGSKWSKTYIVNHLCTSPFLYPFSPSPPVQSNPI